MISYLIWFDLIWWVWWYDKNDNISILRYDIYYMTWLDMIWFDEYDHMIRMMISVSIDMVWCWQSCCNDCYYYYRMMIMSMIKLLFYEKSILRVRLHLIFFDLIWLSLTRMDLIYIVSIIISLPWHSLSSYHITSYHIIYFMW